MTSHKPALAFKRQFDLSEGATEYILVNKKIMIDDNQYCFVKDSRKIRIFQGGDVEELFFTREFFTIIDNLGIPPSDMIREFTKALNQDAIMECSLFGTMLFLQSQILAMDSINR